MAALAIVAVQQGRHADDVTSQAHDRVAAERVAGEFSETLFTFDAATPTAHLDRLRQLATKAYQPKVDEARQTALAGSSAGAAQASMTAHVTDVYLTELSGDQAHAVDAVGLGPHRRRPDARPGPLPPGRPQARGRHLEGGHRRAR